MPAQRAIEADRASSDAIELTMVSRVDYLAISVLPNVDLIISARSACTSGGTLAAMVRCTSSMNSFWIAAGNHQFTVYPEPFCSLAPMTKHASWGPRLVANMPLRIKLWIVHGTQNRLRRSPPMQPRPQHGSEGRGDVRQGSAERPRAGRRWE